VGPAEKARPAPDWLILAPVSTAAPVTFTKKDDGSLLVAGQPATFTFVAHTLQKGITALRLEALPDSSLPKRGPAGRRTAISAWPN